jgi:RecB family endonuclease NucS
VDLKGSITLGEGRGNTFIVFLKRGRKEIAAEAVNSRVVRELRRRLCQKVKQEQPAKTSGRR